MPRDLPLDPVYECAACNGPVDPSRARRLIERSAPIVCALCAETETEPGLLDTTEDC